MNIDRTMVRICAAIILCAVFVRILDSSAISSAQQADVASAIVFLQTGRVVRLTTPAETAPAATQPQPTETAPVPIPMPISFSGEDAALVEVNDYAGKKPDTASLLSQPLNWNLRTDTPSVLILHTHATESYTQTESYTESSDYRTLDENYNVISIGEHIAQILTQEGITVLHDKTLHDHPSYNGSYANARETMRQYLQKYPSIRLVLDIHRDAMADSAGNQIGYTVSTEKGTAAKVMLVVGCNNSDWVANAAVGVKLQVQLEKLCPGICRPMALRKSRFNQDLSAGAVLIEMGAAGNTRQEALVSAEYVAQAIAELAYGTK